MDLQTFSQRIQLLSRFPEALVQYAQAVGLKLSDKDRSELCAKLESEYADFVTLEDARIEHQAQMLEELVAFRKEHIPTLQKGVEAAEHASAENILDA